MSSKVGNIISLVLRALALAMGVAVIVLHILGVADERTMIFLLGIGLLALAVTAFQE